MLCFGRVPPQSPGFAGTGWGRLSAGQREDMHMRRLGKLGWCPVENETADLTLFSNWACCIPGLVETHPMFNLEKLMAIAASSLLL